MWSLWMTAMAAETFFGSTFEPKTALVFESPRARGKLELLLVEASVTCDDARDVHQRSAWLRDKVKMVAATFPSATLGAVAKEVSAAQGLDNMAIGAIQAIEEAGKKPGEDIIVLSIDGMKSAFEAAAKNS